VLHWGQTTYRVGQASEQSVQTEGPVPGLGPTGRQQAQAELWEFRGRRKRPWGGVERGACLQAWFHSLFKERKRAVLSRLRKASKRMMDTRVWLGQMIHVQVNSKSYSWKD